MTVRELLARITSYELTEWEAFERVNGPLGGVRGDYQAALIASNIANAFGKKHRKLSEFVLKWDRGATTQSWEEQLARVKAMNRRMGGTQHRKEE